MVFTIISVSLLGFKQCHRCLTDIDKFLYKTESRERFDKVGIIESTEMIIGGRVLVHWESNIYGINLLMELSIYV